MELSRVKEAKITKKSVNGGVGPGKPHVVLNSDGS